MRILIVNSFYYPDEPGGAERSIKILADALTHAGHQVAVLATGMARTEPEVIDGVRVYRVGSRNIAQRIPTGFRRLRKAAFHLHNTYTSAAREQMWNVCEDFRPDVVHTNNLAWFSVAVWDAAKALGVPVVHTLRDYSLLCANYQFFRNGKPCGPERCMACGLLSINKIKATRHVKVVVGNSQYTLDRHLELGAFPHAMSHVIYNGYRPEKPMPPRRHPRRDGCSFTFGAIGRLSPHKGTDLLVRSFMALCAKHPAIELRLLLAGDGDAAFVGQLKNLCGRAPVQFLGVIPQQRFFDQIDACVVPSLWAEPLSRVLFEAFANGVPVIATSTGGSSELIQFPETGWLVAPNDPSKLIVAMDQALTSFDLYERLSLSALKKSFEFTPERVFNGYLNVFSTACEGK